MIGKKHEQKTHDEMYADLMEANEKMNNNNMKEVMYSASMNIKFQNMKKANNWNGSKTLPEKMDLVKLGIKNIRDPVLGKK